MDIYEFLTELTTSPRKQQQFAHNPDKVMADHGLDPELRSNLHRSAAIVECGQWNRADAIFDPNYDPPPPM